MDRESEDPVTLKSYFFIWGITSLNNSRCSGQGIRGYCDPEIIFFSYREIYLSIIVGVVDRESEDPVTLKSYFSYRELYLSIIVGVVDRESEDTVTQKPYFSHRGNYITQNCLLLKFN